jgi:hypothetical protein
VQKDQQTHAQLASGGERVRKKLKMKDRWDWRKFIY